MMKNSKEHKTALPELRFPEFRGAEGWEDTLLGKKVNFFKGKGLPKSEITLDGLNQCVHYGELFTSYSEVIHTIRSKTNLDNCFLSYSNDVLMPTSDVTPNGLAKACCINVDNVQLGGDILILRTDKSKINGEFLCRQIRHKERKVLQLISGSTVYHLYSSSIEKLNIAIPSINEQKKIAECFSSLDDLISAVTDKIEALKDHKKGLMQQLFPAEGSTVPARRFPEFQNSGEWQVVKLGDVGHPLMCKRILKEQTTSDSVGNVPFYKIGTFGGNADAYISKGIFDDYKQKYSYPNKGDILISAAGTIGRLVVYDGKPAYFQDSNIVWIDNDETKILNSFLYIVYQTVMWQTSDGGVVSRLYNDNLKNTTIIFPRNKKEQQAIADFMFSVDDLISAETDKLDQLKTHKKGLMQRLFPKV